MRGGLVGRRGEGYAKTFKELMEDTHWDSYGTGKYEKCANCMAHCGYEPTAANAALVNPLMEMWKFAAQAFKVGKNIEGSIDEASEQDRKSVV
mgnify:CR=1 FL=1